MMVGACSKTLFSSSPRRDAGRHGLRQLQHGRVDTSGRRSGDRELFVDQFGKGDQFFVAGKGVAGHYAHFSHGVGRGGVGRAGTVGRLHNHILKFGRGLKAVVHQVQAGACGSHTVSQLKDLFARSLGEVNDGEVPDRVDEFLKLSLCFFGLIRRFFLALVHSVKLVRHPVYGVLHAAKIGRPDRIGNSIRGV